jgi:TRAP-type C4-dicarboxylate transport system permease small subunit
MSGFERAINSISVFLKWVGTCVLLVMMSLTVINVLVRPFYRSILGIPEIIEYGFVIVVSLGLAYVAVVKGNVAVELLASHFKPRAQAACDVLGNLVGLGVFSIVAWQSAVFGWKQGQMGEFAPVLEFPLLPFRYAVVLGSTVLCLVLLIHLVKSIAGVVKK